MIFGSFSFYKIPCSEKQSSQFHTKLKLPYFCRKCLPRPNKKQKPSLHLLENQLPFILFLKLLLFSLSLGPESYTSDSSSSLLMTHFLDCSFQIFLKYDSSFPSHYHHPQTSVKQWFSSLSLLLSSYLSTIHGSQQNKEKSKSFKGGF